MTWIVLGLLKTLNDKQDKELQENMRKYLDSTWIELVKTLNDEGDKELSEKMRQYWDSTWILLILYSSKDPE